VVKVAVAGIGLVAALTMLALRLPLESVSAWGSFWTLVFFVLDPPFCLIQAIVPHGAHDLETSSWPRLEYPVAALTAIGWWLLLAVWMARRARRGTNERRAA
jgi:hypothetical protein